MSWHKLGEHESARALSHKIHNVCRSLKKRTKFKLQVSKNAPNAVISGHFVLRATQNWVSAAAALLVVPLHLFVALNMH